MEKEKKSTIHHLFWYFIIFSILGLIIETLYCYIGTGVFESRKGLIWGPFCPVYGVCGAGLIYILEKLNCKTISQLFIAGIVLGSIGEYFLSYILEAIYGIKFWNYEYLQYNLNGRISLLFSFYWGVLSVVLIKFVKPLIDKGLNKLGTKPRNVIDILIFIFLVIDCIFTVWGIQTYQNRVLKNIQTKENSNNIFIELKNKIENDYFTNERMSKIFPNLRIRDENGNEVWIKTLIND